MTATMLRRALERRVNTWEQMQAVIGAAEAGGRDLSAEEAQTWDRLEASLRDDTATIERLERANALETRLETVDRSGLPAEDRTGDDRADAAEDRAAAYQTAFGAYLRRGLGGVPAEQRDLLEAGFVPGDQLRAQGISTDAAGGFLVPEGFRNRLQETMRFYAALRPIAETITTDSGNNLPWPTNDDTGNEGAYLAEQAEVPEQDMTFGQRQLGAHTITSKMVKVSRLLLQDSAFGLEEWLPRKLGERIGRRENRAFTLGSGIEEPKGVQVNAVVGKTGAGGQTTSVTYDDLIDLEHSVDVAYRNERSRWMFHDLTLAALRKVKDADGRPLWQPSLQAGVASTLNGRPYTVNNNMPTMAAAAKSILFGDFFAGYVIRDVRAVGLIRLEERYAERLQVAFFSFARHDGMAQDTAAIRAYANAAA